VTAALVLGASAVMIGTTLLRTPEAAVAPAWADAIGRAKPEDTGPHPRLFRTLGPVVTDRLCR
jgi:nitronate monooxygenase